MLVPLTGSLYVPGKLCDVENVMVDVGTGYYVQKVSIPLKRSSHALIVAADTGAGGETLRTEDRIPED